MTTHVLLAQLQKPKALNLEGWEAIQDPFSRLRGAVEADDRPLIVGSAKDLVEATARVVLSARGHPASSGDEYDQVLKAAHSLIERQPGEGLAPNDVVRAAAINARKLASCLRELRNAYGTGHGRATMPVIQDEILETCVDGALLWTRWALRRLQFLLIGDLQQLVADLSGSAFSMGELTARLQAADLPGMAADDQRLLGVAVGQRAARDTFTVRINGVEACAESQDDAQWPASYREGVAEGLFLDAQGQVLVDSIALGPGLAARVLVPHPQQTGVVEQLETKVRAATWAPGFAQRCRAVIAEMRIAEGIFLEEGARAAWERIIAHFDELIEVVENAR